MILLIESALELAGETMRFVNEKQRTRYMDEYHSLLTELKEAKDRFDNYTDIDVCALESRLAIFMKAYTSEIKKTK